jgi:hypothetical protein
MPLAEVPQKQQQQVQDKAAEVQQQLSKCFRWGAGLGSSPCSAAL